MRWIKNLLRPKIQVDLKSIEIAGKVILIRYSGEISGVAVDILQDFAQLLERNGALSAIVVDESFVIEVADVATLEKIILKAKEKINGTT